GRASAVRREAAAPRDPAELRRRAREARPPPHRPLSRTVSTDMPFQSHDLVENVRHAGLAVEPMPVRDPAGEIVPGLHATRIALDNPTQLNSYTTEMVKGVILAMRAASND